MLDQAIRWSVVAAFSVTLIIAAFSDARYRIIPNWTVVFLIFLFIPWLFVGPKLSLGSSLLSVLIIFTAGIVLHVLGMLGAGDVKLAAVVSLFVGFPTLYYFIIVTAISGGVIAIIILGLEAIRTRPKIPKLGTLRKLSVPYGIAIALGGIVTFWQSLRTV